MNDEANEYVPELNSYFSKLNLSISTPYLSVTSSKYLTKNNKTNPNLFELYWPQLYWVTHICHAKISQFLTQVKGNLCFVADAKLTARVLKEKHIQVKNFISEILLGACLETFYESYPFNWYNYKTRPCGASLRNFHSNIAMNMFANSIFSVYMSPPLSGCSYEPDQPG